jgi:Sec-independent protein secretion pathway component TatC
VNAQPVDRMSTADVVAGFLSVIAIAAAFFSLAYRPVRVDVFAIILSFVAAGLADRNRRLAAVALGISAGCFILGLLIAILADKPLF